MPVYRSELTMVHSEVSLSVQVMVVWCAMAVPFVVNEMMIPMNSPMSVRFTLTP